MGYLITGFTQPHGDNEHNSLDLFINSDSLLAYQVKSHKLRESTLML